MGGWVSDLSGLKIDTECDNAFRDCPDSLWNCVQKLVEGLVRNPTSFAIVFQCREYFSKIIELSAWAW